MGDQTVQRDIEVGKKDFFVRRQGEILHLTSFIDERRWKLSPFDGNNYFAAIS